ncbi:hypothetical protein PVAND_003778 [Polypedilum vanderplanki]|uniref:Uncharacterized protein n=1 Tax=Polypedilum vanderplanki TaxID=319348 RepID=A0A9J6BWY0_POLVA|nr:hypothetical protein PVAND_003778 [Polypedilum vanderplanki]
MSKIEKKERRMKFTAMTEDAIHYPSLSSYDINNLYNDLLNFAACRLKMNGRLVMWFPIADHLIEENIFPEHTALQLVSKSRQQLISETSRILLTYEKISDHGEIVIKEHNYDFREKYFMQNLDKETKQELRDATAKRNNEEAAKRGNKIYSREEWREYHKRKRNERN